MILDVRETMKIYLDTSIISAYFDNRAPERQESTKIFWKEILSQYEVFISEITKDELMAAGDADLRGKFEGIIKDFTVLSTNEKIHKLAREYINYEIFPEKYLDDSMHVAIASYHDIDYILSWNFEHIVKVKTRKLVKSVNVLNDFREIEIVSPQEL